MPDRSTSPLAYRRALFAALVVGTICGILGLASVAVPTRSLGAVAFLALFAITLPWTVIGFWNAAIGLLLMRSAPDPVAAVNPMAASVRGDEPITASTAILMCVRNENPRQVVRNLQPLARDLIAKGFAPLFHIYLLSDSDDLELIAEEEACFAAFAANRSGSAPVTYRRRLANAGFKAGNIRDFCERWGERHDAGLGMVAGRLRSLLGTQRDPPPKAFYRELRAAKTSRRRPARRSRSQPRSGRGRADAAGGL